MGGLPAHRSSGLDHHAMKSVRLAVFFLVGLCFGGLASYSFAATIPYKFNGMNVTRDGGVTYLRGTSPSEVAAAGVSVSNHAISSAGSANWYAGTGALLQSGGVTFNSVLPLASTAAAVAVTAVRANPAGLVTSAVASYLVSKGIHYANDAFTVQNQIAPQSMWKSDLSYGTTEQEACEAAANTGPWGGPGYSYNLTEKCSGPSPSSGGVCRIGVRLVGNTDCNTYWQWTNTQVTACAGGVAPVNGSCGSGTRPASDSDWDAARSGYWSDPAILDLVKNGVPLPTDKPVFTPPYKDVPLSDPYVDPVSGKRLQDVARVTPQPSSPELANVQVVKQEVDENGQPVAGSPPTAADDKDPCDLHPERIGCSQWGEPENAELDDIDKQINITPQSGWGPDNGTCPAPLTYTTHKGQLLTMKYDPVCQGATYFRPAILGMAWISAIFAFFGISRRTES